MSSLICNTNSTSGITQTCSVISEYAVSSQIIEFFYFLIVIWIFLCVLMKLFYLK